MSFVLGAEIQLHRQPEMQLHQQPVTTCTLFLMQRSSAISDQSLNCTSTSFVFGAEIQLYERPVNEKTLLLVQKSSSIIGQSLHVLCSWCRDPAASLTSHYTSFVFGAEIQLHHRPVTTRPLFLVQRSSSITDQSLNVLCSWCRDPAPSATGHWMSSLFFAQRYRWLSPSATRLWTSPSACRWTTEAWHGGCLATSMGSLVTTSFFPMVPLWPLTWPTDRSTKTLDPSVSYFWL